MAHTRREALAELDPELLCADGLDDAIIGIVHRFGSEPVALYDKALVLKILMADGTSREDAEEHFSYNVIGAWVGERTPAYADLLPPPTKKREDI